MLSLENRLIIAGISEAADWVKHRNSHIGAAITFSRPNMLAEARSFGKQKSAKVFLARIEDRKIPHFRSPFFDNWPPNPLIPNRVGDSEVLKHTFKVADFFLENMASNQKLMVICMRGSERSAIGAAAMLFVKARAQNMTPAEAAAEAFAALGRIRPTARLAHNVAGHLEGSMDADDFRAFKKAADEVSASKKSSPTPRQAKKRARFEAMNPIKFLRRRFGSGLG